MIACRRLTAWAGMALIGLQAVAAVDPTPVLCEGFEATGTLTGRVGKAGKSYLRDARGLVNMERGTIAYFYQSATEPKETEWNSLGGVSSENDAGYWRSIMRFQLRRREFLFNYFDVGFYSPPLKFESIFGRWKAGEWHHLAAVWDRLQGVTIYEDGKRVNSNWGRHRWEWSCNPESFALSGPVDEVAVFADCLTDAQIAQLARGEKVTGPVIPTLAMELRRPLELARMGWTGEDLAALPVVTPDQPLAFTFARINRCVDAKRPVAYPIEGLWQTTWPSLKYGPSIRGQRLEMALDDGQSYDRIRLFIHRPFSGELVRPTISGKDESILPIQVAQSMFWHRRLPAPCSDTALVLKREAGQMGQIDLYRVDPLDAARLPAKTEAYSFVSTNQFPDTEPGKVLMGEVPRDQWNPVAAVKGPVAAWALESPAFGGFQAIAEEPADAQAFDGVVATFVVEGLTEPTPVHIEVKEPVLTDRVWLAADAVLKPQGSGRQSFVLVLKGKPVINLPPMPYRKSPGKGRLSAEALTLPGVGFTVKVTAANPVTWIMGQGGSSVKFAVTELAAALPKATDDQVEWMREAYAENMEGHRYSWRRIQMPLRWLAKFAPDRMECRQMWERVEDSRPNYVGLDVKPLVYPEPANNTGAPEWAFWQKVVMDLHRSAVHRIIDQQQVWTGELGGVWNDDSDHMENWIDYILCIDGQGNINDAMQRYWNGVYNYQLTEGVGKYTQDTCHYSEEGSSSLGMRLLVDYGDPVAYARTMAAVSHIKNWVNPDPKGGYLFKSGWVGPDSAWTEGAFLLNKKPTGHETDVLVSLGYLVWYNRHPQAVDYIVGLTPGMHFLSAAYDRVTDWKAARKRYADTLALKEEKTSTGALIYYANEVGVPEAVRKTYATPYQPLGKVAHYMGYKDTDEHWLAWKMSGDIRFLVDSYKRTAGWFYSHDWLNTDARPSMDRNPLPRTSLTRSRLGAIAANRGSSGNDWPLYALSYVRGGDEAAALVTENEENRFAVRLYPFTAQPMEMQIRAWRCNGTFKVTLASDKNDDGVPEETIWEQEMALDRGADIRFTLPPKQGSMLMVRPIKVAEPNYDRPDPAISLNSIELVYGDQLVVKVYNNGTRPVDDVLVRVRDARSGEIISGGEQSTGPIEAPLDLKPRLKTVEFKNVNANTYGGLIIEIDPDHRIDDFNRHNNSVVLNYRATFTLDQGWK